MKNAIYSIAFAVSALVLFSAVLSGLFIIAVSCCSLLLIAIVLDQFFGGKGKRRKPTAACPNCPSTWK